MISLVIRSLALIGVMTGTCPVFAGQSPDQSQTHASTPASSPAPSAVAAAPAVSATPSPDVLKRAKLAGYRIKKLRQGTTVFCKEESHVGTRFSTNSCIDETQLEELLLRVQSQRDSMNNRVGTQSNTK
jgi:hypothetical protein